METRPLGSLEVSLVGLGCNNFGWKLDADASARVVEAALDAGINFFDTADVYGQTHSEEFLGKALGRRRHQALIATKFGSKIDDQRKGAKPDYIRRAVEDSLRRLGANHIDLYQLHQPDPDTPIADTLGALDELVQAGKVRQIGCSNFSLQQLREAAGISANRSAARFAAVQNEYNLLHRDPEQDVLPECARTSVGFLPYFPLASGLLTGKYRKGQPPPPASRIGSEERFASKLLTDEKLTAVEALIRFAELHQHTLLELAFSWLSHRPAVVSIIAGATTPAQVKSNAAAVGWKLTDAELAEVDTIVPPPAAPRPPEAGSSS